MSMPTRACKYCDKLGHHPYQCFFRPNGQSKPCKYCGSIEHLSWQCFNNPKRQEEMKSKLKNGKVARAWIATRDKWFRKNRADYYICYLCGKRMPKNETTLDHIKSRSRHPELRNELSNLAPCCVTCNYSKGSRSLEELEKQG